jgi:ubiquinone/menaquinone biosynthesis C-methylase UbiE
MKANNDLLTDKQGWNDYWSAKKKKNPRILYDTISEFYRKFLIRPALNYFIKKYFKPGATILHAGCGSGQVDADIRHYVSITGLDLSPNALEIYNRENGGICKSLHGSIFSIPLQAQSVDGIYNLGVMEHFSEDEIGQILLEFKRVLKPQGRMVIFWPPEFGLSVIFFKVLKVLFKVVTFKDVKFHPDEICRVQSKKHVRQIFEKSGFNVLDYYFGLRDFFTYSVIVVEKE